MLQHGSSEEGAKHSVADLRAQLDAAFQQLVRVSWLLIESDQATWGDLLSALGSYDCISERAAFRLHGLLSVPIGGVLRRDPAFWKLELETRRLGFDETVSHFNKR